MTERIFYLDIATLVILVIALISQLTRRMTKGTANHFFLILVSVTLLSCSLEIWADALDNLCVPDLMLRRFAHSVQMIVYHNAMLPFICAEPDQRMVQAAEAKINVDNAGCAIYR